jgi:hypothetical protein
MEPYPLIPTIGTIPPDKIVGRAAEIQQLRQLLAGQSVTIEEFRRMGKTMLVQKLEHLSEKNKEANQVIYFMLQGVADVGELTDRLLDRLRKEEQLGLLKVGWNHLRRLYNTAKPEEVKIWDITFRLPEFKQKWKQALTACLEDLAERTHKDDAMLTLVMDEFPVMLWDWLQQNKARDVIELLDLFRQLRINLKERGRLRFVICGSIGMQVVLDRLRREYRYTGEPFNDLAHFRLEPMSDADALFLCRCLALSGFSCTSNEEVIYRQISRFAENIPVFIHLTFRAIQTEHRAALNATTVEAAQTAILNDASRDSPLSQFHHRIGLYYPGPKATLMWAILRHLSRQTDPVAESTLQQLVPTSQPEELLDALETLREEQYLVRTVANDIRQYQFKYNLLKRWWKLNK